MAVRFLTDSSKSVKKLPALISTSNIPGKLSELTTAHSHHTTRNPTCVDRINFLAYNSRILDAADSRECSRFIVAVSPTGSGYRIIAKPLCSTAGISLISDLVGMYGRDVKYV